jgi:hypothetical protein
MEIQKYVSNIYPKGTKYKHWGIILLAISLSYLTEKEGGMLNEPKQI